MQYRLTHWQRVAELATSARVVVIVCHCCQRKCRHLPQNSITEKKNNNMLQASLTQLNNCIKQLYYIFTRQGTQIKLVIILIPRDIKVKQKSKNSTALSGVNTCAIPN